MEFTTARTRRDVRYTGKGNRGPDKGLSPTSASNCAC